MNKDGLGKVVGERKFKKKIKPKNPEENSNKLPEFLKGKHIDHYMELLEELEKEDDIRAYE